MLALSFFTILLPLLGSLAVLARNSHRRDQSLPSQHRRLASDIGPVPRAASTSSPEQISGAEENPDLRKRDGRKYIFMHHIVGNTYPYVYDDWLEDVNQIAAVGVDAIALNIGRDPWQRDRVVDAYNAAEASGTGLKMFISFDYSSFVCDNGAATVEWTNQFAQYPAQFRVNGKPMVSTWGGGYDCLGVENWKRVKKETDSFLMPFFWDSENTFQTDWKFLDSWYCWGCAFPQGNWDKNTTDDVWYQHLLGDDGRFATTVSGSIYTHLDSKNFYLRGDDWLLVNRWEQLFEMRDSLTFVEMITWNDWGESDYFGPFRGAQPDGTYWAEGFDHYPWMALSKYYIEAFKTGVYPTITEDVIYWWARPHPAAATATSDPYPKPSGWDWADDFLWSAVFCSSPGCSVTLSLGSVTQTFNDLPYGVSKLKIPLVPGTVRVRMVKGSTTVIDSDETPTGFSVVATPSLYNYNVFVGAATATPTAVVSKSTPAPDPSPTPDNDGEDSDNSASNGSAPPSVFPRPRALQQL